MMETVNSSMEQKKNHSNVQRIFWVIYIALLVLLLATVAIAYIPMGRFNLVLAAIIAITKALLVVLYFMELKETGKQNAVFFGAGIFMLLVAGILSFTDYLTRG